MPSWFERWSIRTRLNLLVLAIVLPLAATLAWLLLDDLHQMREAADARVRILANTAAADVARFLRHSQGMLERLAERPLVRAMDPGRCDPIFAEFSRLEPDYVGLSLRDRQGNIVCTGVPDPIERLDPAQSPWFAAGLNSQGFAAGDAIVRRGSGRWTTVLSHPIRNEAGNPLGLLALPVDLLGLGQQLLTSTPKHALTTIIDSQGATLLRSVDAPAFIGTRPERRATAEWQGLGDGVTTLTGEDGVRRLIAVAAIPGSRWRATAALPEAEVLADYRSTLHHTAAIALGLLLLAMALAWRLGAALVRPIAALSRTAAAVAGGDLDARAAAGGPVEISTVAEQFNEMLDARDRGEAALKESEQRYRTLVDWSPEAISVHRDNTVLFVNQACVDMLGATSAQDLVGQSSLDFLHPDFHPIVKAQVQEAVAQGRAVPRMEEKLFRVDGAAIDVEVQGMPIVYGGQAAMFASMRDITARKQTELALQRSEARLQGIFDSATDAILSVDAAQSIVVANPAAAAMFHCPLDALIGAPLHRLLPERHRAQHALDLRAFGESAVSARQMGRLRDVMALRANGEEFPVDASISQHRVDGKPLYTVILRDISERQLQAASLRDSEARLRRLLMLLPEAVFVDSGDRISLVNEAAQRLFGSDEATLLGRRPLELIHPESHARVKARIAALRSGVTLAPAAEVTILRADGTTRRVESVESMIDNREETSIVVVMHDVTELRQAQLALAQSHADLRRLFAAQDRVQEHERKRIARELHDDLQQTLAAIKIDLGVMHDRLADDPAGLTPLLDEADGLTTAALVSTRRIVDDLRPQMLEDLGLAPALEMLATGFSKRTGIACHLETQGPASDELMASPAAATCLFRVTQEALNNVLKHAHASSVRIRLASARDGRILLRISDNGRGLPSDSGSKPEAYGLLGMHERVRALGGVLRIHSQPGIGTTVQVLLSVSNHLPALPETRDGPRPDERMDPLERDTPPIDRPPGIGGYDALDAAPAARIGSNGAPMQGIIDALAGNVALLDPQGVIVLVNRAWREFAERNGDPGDAACGPGVSYLEVCRRSAPNDALAQQVLQGLQDLLDGRQAVFEITYPCHSPNERRWFRMHAAPMLGGNILVNHFKLGAWIDPAQPGEASA